MHAETTRLEVDGASLFVRHWRPEGPVRGILQVLHGMGEHSARYARLAGFLAEHGWATVCHDHRGHGQTPTSDADRMFLAEERGLDVVADDARQVSLQARDWHPDVPHLLFCHSMGGYIGQILLLAHDDYQGAVLSGISLNTGPLIAVLTRVARFERWRLGARRPSPLLQRLSFGDFARKIPDRRTDFDWLSTDPAEVDAYIDDPRCGEPATTGLWVDLTTAFERLDKPEQLARIRQDLPIRILAGGDDPVHDGGKGFRALVALYRQRGFDDLSETLYPGKRHELLNEVGRDDIMKELLAWMERVAPAPDATA